MSNFPGEIIPADFNSTDPITLEPATLSSGAAVVYRDDSTTESSTGVTLTADYDGRTGYNKCQIDTSADDVFYAAQHAFTVVLSAGTVAGVNVAGAVIKRFTLAVQEVTLSEDDIDSIGATVAELSAPTDVNIENVPTSRTFLLIASEDDESLISESTKRLRVDDPLRLFAIDFRNDASTNQKIHTITSVTLIDGDADGITIDDAANWGKEGTQAKVKFSASAAGDYRVRVQGKYDSSGGQPFSGDILFEAVD